MNWGTKSRDKEKGENIMSLHEISGKRQLEFMQQFTYIREAGTEGE